MGCCGCDEAVQPHRGVLPALVVSGAAHHQLPAGRVVAGARRQRHRRAGSIRELRRIQDADRRLPPHHAVAPLVLKHLAHRLHGWHGRLARGVAAAVVWLGGGALQLRQLRYLQQAGERALPATSGSFRLLLGDRPRPLLVALGGGGGAAEAAVLGWCCGAGPPALADATLKPQWAQAAVAGHQWEAKRTGAGLHWPLALPPQCAGTQEHRKWQLRRQVAHPAHRDMCTAGRRENISEWHPRDFKL